MALLIDVVLQTSPNFTQTLTATLGGLIPVRRVWRIAMTNLTFSKAFRHLLRELH